MRVLVADDDKTTRVLLTRTLERWGYQVTAVADGEEALQEITRSSFRMLISDWEMPKLDGPSLCQRIRLRKEGDHVFILLLTSHTDSERIVQGLEAGADDFVTKPFVPAELRARLGVGRRFIALQDELATRYRQLERANQQLSLIAATDPLMNIGNRRTLEKALAEIHAQARASDRPYGFLMVDIDHFKSVNDRHGHAMGDRVLSAVADALRSTLPEGGSAFRYGGEEIAVVLPGASVDETAECAERVRAAVADLRLDVGDGVPLKVTASFGTAWSGDEHSADWHSLVERADTALYAAKGQGRNRVIRWSPTTGRPAGEER